MVALVEGPVDLVWWGGGFGEGEALEAGDEGVDLALKLSGVELVECSGQGRAELLPVVWGPEFVDNTNYVRVYVAHLRKKLEPDPAHPIYLVTEPGLGVRFEAEPQRAAN
jgi:two-component system KDP operon response regulator KdpE